MNSFPSVCRDQTPHPDGSGLGWRGRHTDVASRPFPLPVSEVSEQRAQPQPAMLNEDGLLRASSPRPATCRGRLPPTVENEQMETSFLPGLRKEKTHTLFLGVTSARQLWSGGRERGWMGQEKATTG